MNLTEITDLCKAYAKCRDDLDAVSAEIADARRQAVKTKLRALKGAVARCSAMREELTAAIKSSPELFERPRTRAVHGIKVGYRKLTGRFDTADEGRTIELVGKHLPDRLDEIVRVRRSLDKAALKKLTGRELKMIGIRLVQPDDEIVISAASSDLDKLVDALLADGEEERK